MLSLSNLRTGFLSLHLLLSLSVQASHFNSGEIYYRWAPTATDTARYEVFVNWYRFTSGVALTQNNQIICVSSSCFPDVLGTLSRILPPAGSEHPTDVKAWLVERDSCANLFDANYKDVSVHKFSGFVTLPGLCGDFIFSANPVCCRDRSTNIAMPSGNIHLEAKLNNTLGHTSSAEFISSPSVALCIQPTNPLPTRFFQTAFDPEGDPIRYEFAQPLKGSQCGPSIPLPYDSGYTVLTAIPSSIGMQLDQSTGSITLRPTQQGSFVVKINVLSRGFDTLNLVWVETSSASRELQIPVTAQCNPFYHGNGTASLPLKPGTFMADTFSQSEVDSLVSAFQVTQILKDTGQFTSIPYLTGYDCGDTSIFLEFRSEYDWSGITPTDFRLIGPDSNLAPIVQIQPIDLDSTTNLTKGVELKILNTLNRNGNYLLQIRRGNDNTTFYNSCDNAVAEFLSILVPISGCPSGIGVQEFPYGWSVANIIAENQSQFRVSNTGDERTFHLKVYNQLGQLEYQNQSLQSDEGWDGSDLSSGIYIYQLETTGKGPHYFNRGRLIILN